MAYRALKILLSCFFSFICGRILFIFFLLLLCKIWAFNPYFKNKLIANILIYSVALGIGVSVPNLKQKSFKNLIKISLILGIIPCILTYIYFYIIPDSIANIAPAIINAEQYVMAYFSFTVLIFIFIWVTLLSFFVGVFNFAVEDKLKTKEQEITTYFSYSLSALSPSYTFLTDFQTKYSSILLKIIKLTTCTIFSGLCGKFLFHLWFPAFNAFFGGGFYIKLDLNYIANFFTLYAIFLGIITSLMKWGKSAFLSSILNGFLCGGITFMFACISFFCKWRQTSGTGGEYVIVFLVLTAYVMFIIASLFSIVGFLSCWVGFVAESIFQKDKKLILNLTLKFGILTLLMLITNSLGRDYFLSLNEKMQPLYQAKEAVKQNPSIGNYLELAQALEQDKKVFEAEKIYLDIIFKHPDTRQAIESTGYLYDFYHRHLREIFAISLCERIIKEFKGKEIEFYAHNLLGDYYFHKDTKKAIFHYKKAYYGYKKIKGNNASHNYSLLALYDLGRCYHQQWKYAEALKIFSQIIHENPQHEIVPRASYEKGLIYFYTEIPPYKNAKSIFWEIKQKYLRDWKNQDLSKNAQHYLDKIDKENKMYEGLRKENLSEEEISYKFAEYYKENNNAEKAVYMYEKLAVSSNKKIKKESLKELVNFYIGQEKDIDKGKTLLKELIKIYPDVVLTKRTIYNIGYYNIEDSQEIFLKMLKSNPKSEVAPYILLNIGYLFQYDYRLQKNNRLKKAISIFQRIAENHPDSEEAQTALYQIATIYTENKELDKALKYWEKLKRNYPDGEHYNIAIQKVKEIRNQ